MAVHMVRVLFEPPKGNAETAVNNWVQNFTEWTGDTISHELTETDTGLDGSGEPYIRGDYRFEQTATKTEILDDLSARLQSLQGGLWHRLGYHVCRHDEDSPSPCSWDDVVEYDSGRILAGVPTFT